MFVATPIDSIAFSGIVSSSKVHTSVSTGYLFGGGVLITQAIHTLDIMLLLCGPVKEVHGMVHTSSFHQLEAEDFSGALLNFESGARGTLMASTTHFPGHKEEIILNCSEAYLCWYNKNNILN